MSRAWRHRNPTKSSSFQLRNSDSSQVHVSWTFFKPVLYQSIVLTLAASRSAIPIILSSKWESHYYQFLKILVSRGRGSNPRPPFTSRTLTTSPPRQITMTKEKTSDLTYLCVSWARIHQPFSRTVFVFFSKICKFECNTTSDWLNRMV